jgi:hypothetical protein
VTKFGICSSNTFKVMPLQIKFKMAAVSHLGLSLSPYCNVLTVPLDVLTLWPNLEYVAEILFKLCPFKNIQDGGRQPCWIKLNTLLQSYYNASRCADIVTKFGICSSNTFQVISLQIKFNMAVVRHLGLCLAPYCRVLTVPLDVLTLRPNLEYVAQILLKLCHFK